MIGHILTKAKAENLDRLQKKLKPCPLCGRKAYLSHDIVDGFDFGYSVGCPVACINDGIHGLNDYDSFHAAKITYHGLFDAEKAVQLWNTRCKKGGRT